MNEQPYFVEDEAQSSAMLQNDEFIRRLRHAPYLGVMLFSTREEQAAQVSVLASMDIA
ncbi:MAG: hypothetical protein ACLT98_05640 [Eggerthellaceae bacterium]